MGNAVFDTLRFARGLREVGVPEPQAERQAELMAEAFSAFADNLVTKDYFSEVLTARLNEQSALLEQRIMARVDKRFAEQDAKFEARFAEQDTRFVGLDAKFEARFAEQDAKFEARFDKQDARFDKHEAILIRLDRTLLLHTWMLGFLVLALGVPAVRSWFPWIS